MSLLGRYVYVYKTGTHISDALCAGEVARYFVPWFITRRMINTWFNEINSHLYHYSELSWTTLED